MIGGSIAAALALSAGGHERRAVIIDQLSLTAPNPDFLKTSTRTLELAGYKVDYVAGRDVTVDYYRNLPSHHYDMILLRVHSGLTTITNADTGQVTHTQSVSLFSGQDFDRNLYRDEQDRGYLGRSRYLQDSQEVLGVFGIEPGFVQYSMKGSLNGALVVLMGCNGVDAPTMAEAFLAKGARGVVGWNNFVSAGFTDKVTLDLLHGIYDERLPLPDAVKQTRDTFGADPEYGGSLQLIDAISGAAAIARQTPTPAVGP